MGIRYTLNPKLDGITSSKPPSLLSTCSTSKIRVIAITSPFSVTIVAIKLSTITIITTNLIKITIITINPFECAESLCLRACRSARYLANTSPNLQKLCFITCPLTQALARKAVGKLDSLVDLPNPKI